MKPTGTLRCGDREFVVGERTLVMGIVNITPDSFSDGGEFDRPVAAYDHAMRLLDEGADVLDLGAESTRPGATPIDAATELRRLVPVVDRLVAAGVTNLSIDTYKAEVAGAMLERGAAWINDVTGLADPALAGVAARADALVVMHQRPMSSGRAEDEITYADVVTEVRGHLAGLVERAVAAGVERAKVIVDPGLGFGKTVAHNVALLAHIGELRGLGRPVLVGPSRKRFLGVLAGVGLDDLTSRDAATLGACCAAAGGGADLVRVHRVEGVRAALAVADAVRAADAVP